MPRFPRLLRPAAQAGLSVLSLIQPEPSLEARLYLLPILAVLLLAVLSRGGASTATPLRLADWDTMQFHSFPVRATQTVSPRRRPWMRVILRYIQATRTPVLCPNMVAGRRMGRCCFPRPLGRTELRHAVYSGARG